MTLVVFYHQNLLIPNTLRIMSDEYRQSGNSYLMISQEDLKEIEAIEEEKGKLLAREGNAEPGGEDRLFSCQYLLLKN